MLALWDAFGCTALNVMSAVRDAAGSCARHSLFSMTARMPWYDSLYSFPRAAGALSEFEPSA